MCSQPHRQSFFLAIAGVFGAHEGASAGQLERWWHLGAIVLSALDKTSPGSPPPAPGMASITKSWRNNIPGFTAASPRSISRIGEIFLRWIGLGLIPSLPALPFFFSSPPSGTEDGFVALNREDCFTSSGHSSSPLPCCKTPAPARGTVGALCGGRIPPRFYLSPLRSRVLFPLKRKHLLGGGEGVFLLLPLTRRLKERLMGESSPRKPG